MPSARPSPQEASTEPDITLTLVGCPFSCFAKNFFVSSGKDVAIRLPG